MCLSVLGCATSPSSFSPLDSKLATCSDDGTVRIWDFVRCAEEHLLRGGWPVRALSRSSLLVQILVIVYCIVFF